MRAGPEWLADNWVTIAVRIGVVVLIFLAVLFVGRWMFGAGDHRGGARRRQRPRVERNGNGSGSGSGSAPGPPPGTPVSSGSRSVMTAR